MGTLHDNPIYNNIKTLCESHTPRVSISKMCVDLGLSKSLGTKLKDNPAKNINGETAQMIADYFGVSVDRVLGNEQKKTPTPEGERNNEKEEIFKRFEAADEATRAVVLRLLGLQ